MNITWTLSIIACLFYFQPCLGELKLLQAVFRHGNRMPTEGRSYYPNDPYVDLTYEPEGHGGLTNTGKMRSYKLGQYFQEKYGVFLGPTYSKQIIHFRGDEMERVVMTAQLVAAGLFPPSGEQVWNTELNWQPIPVWDTPLAISSFDLLYNSIYCPNSLQWRNEVEKTDPEVVNFIKANKEVYKYLSEHTGGNITQDMTFGLRQLLFAESDVGLTLPKWTKNVFPHGKLDELATFDLLIQSRTQKLKQLLGGIWIREWLKRVENSLNSMDTRKAFMYGAHEINIAPILIALNNFDYQIPSYNSAVIFELHEIETRFYVQIIHRNSEEDRVLQIPGCEDTMCPLEIFKTIVNPILPNDTVTLCGISNLNRGCGVVCDLTEKGITLCIKISQ